MSIRAGQFRLSAMDGMVIFHPTALWRECIRITREIRQTWGLVGLSVHEDTT